MSHSRWVNVAQGIGGAIEATMRSIMWPGQFSAAPTKVAMTTDGVIPIRNTGRYHAVNLSLSSTSTASFLTGIYGMWVDYEIEGDR